MATSPSYGHSPRGGDRKKAADPDILIVEPFYCGSHKQLVDCLMRDEVIGPRVHLVTMSGKKWHWRARVSALHLFSAIPVNHNFKVLFSSSVLNLAELVALRSDLVGLHKVIYFHENQLQYPVQKQKERDFQYGYNQILSCLVADSVLFNSAFNMQSFLAAVNPFLKLVPDYRPKGLADTLRPKCSVLYFPMQYPVHLHSQGKHQNHQGTPTKMQASPGHYCHNLKQNNQLEKGPSTEDMVQAQCTERGQAAETFNTRNSLSSDSSSLMCCSPDFETNTPSNTRTGPHPQAKVGRLDCDLAATMGQQVGRNALQAQDEDGGKFTDPKHHVHEHVHSSFEICRLQMTSPGSVSQKMKNAADFSVDFLIDTTHRPVSEKQCTGGQGHGKPSNCVASSQIGCLPDKEKNGCLHIVWPHRWEHDKDPHSFFQALFRLQEDNQQFLVSVLGETFTDVPAIFVEAEQRLKGQVSWWGYQADKAAYYRILQQADVVVSTSKHEFFGVAMLEAVYLGCYPLCPRSLVYPELYPEECLYSTHNQLYKRLRAFCRQPHLVRPNTLQMDLDKFSWDTLRPVYLSKLKINS